MAPHKGRTIRELLMLGYTLRPTVGRRNPSLGNAFALSASAGGRAGQNQRAIAFRFISSHIVTSRRIKKAESRRHRCKACGIIYRNTVFRWDRRNGRATRHASPEDLT